MTKLWGLLAVVAPVILALANPKPDSAAARPDAAPRATSAPSAAAPAAFRHSIPRQFTPVDTSRLLGSPDPLPLETVWAFPKLRFQRPVELTHAGDGTDRLFVVEQAGVIQVFENRDDVEQAQIFLDVRDVVQSEGYEEGLLGLAFHPQFKKNGEFFVFYTTRPRYSVISRFRVSKTNPSQADRQSEQELLRIERPSGEHTGGCIRFGPDGYLYIGLGDGGSPEDSHGNAQNPQALLGSILRIDVDRQDPGLKYAIPKDNPFVGRDDARGEVWAKGIRNTWRMAFDEQTGDLWQGDVGQHRFEEINLIRRGGNYGWNIREGFEAYQNNTQAKPAQLIDPIIAYDRGLGETVVGGQVYRGGQLPGFGGAYFYGDYVSGRVWLLRWDEAKVIENRQVAATGQYITAFGSDAQGGLYVCTYDGWLFRLRPRPFDVQAMASRFPRKLSETGLFASVQDNEPAAGLIPFEVNVPLWSDYAAKDRYLALPARGAVLFHPQAKWRFPIGAVFVKTFWMHHDRAKLADPRRIETRLLVNAPDGWAGYTYVYNEEQTEACLQEGSRNLSLEIRDGDKTVHQPYYVPSRSDCMTCHTKAEGFVLGMTTRQMNRTLHYRGESENQLDLLNRLDVFSRPLTSSPARLERFPDWGFGNLVRSPAEPTTDGKKAPPPKASKEDVTPLARAWLEVNCAVCHRPQGLAPHYRDMRYHTPLAGMNLVGAVPTQGRLSLPDSLLIKPGHPHESELVFRLGQRGPRQMPPLATHVVDPRALDIIRRWIAAMPEAMPSSAPPLQAN